MTPYKLPITWQTQRKGNAGRVRRRKLRLPKSRQQKNQPTGTANPPTSKASRRSLRRPTSHRPKSRPTSRRLGGQKTREEEKTRLRRKLEQQIATGANALALQQNKKDPLQFELDKELAKQQTVIPKIESTIMALVKTDPARAFILFESALLMTHPTADADSEGNDNSAAASGGGFDDGFKNKVLNYIHANQKGKRKRGDGKTTKPEFFFQGDLAAQRF